VVATPLTEKVKVNRAVGSSRVQLAMTFVLRSVPTTRPTGDSILKVAVRRENVLPFAPPNAMADPVT
jgi:hypothetical protein